MTTSAKPIPEGFHSVTPALVVRDAAKAIDFYKKALGAQELMRMPSPDGKIMHAELKIGDSVIFISDEMPNPGNVKSPQTLGGCTGSFNLYVPNVDDVFQQAIAAGGKEAMPVTDQFWGDRYGSFVDPFGYTWGVGTHKEDLSPEETGERAQEFFAQMAQRKTA
ncbi:MAG: VOC family protein [Candidatus Angelobacter sp.]